MELANHQSTFFLQVIVFFSAIVTHLVRRNSRIITLYALQSLAISILLIIPAFEHQSIIFLSVAFLTFIVKVVIAPIFFYRFINKKELNISVSTYLNLPLTLAVILLLILFAKSDIFGAITFSHTAIYQLFYLPLATIFISAFLLINRKGALSQIIGILSLENGVVALTILLGIEQIPAIELGIIFNIFLWIAIATTFLSLIYTRFGSLDVTKMRHLKE